MAMAASQFKAVAALLVVAVCLTRVAEAANVLLQGYYLSNNGALNEGAFSFVMQTDCNLVLYKSGKALWASNTQNKGTGCYFIMQTDGNGVVYTGSNTAVWATNTCCRNDGEHYIIMQSDGNVVMYNARGSPLWATNTGGLKLELGAAADANGPQSNTHFGEQHVEFIQDHHVEFNQDKGVEIQEVTAKY